VYFILSFLYKKPPKIYQVEGSKMLLDRILSTLTSVSSIINVFDSFQEGTITLQASEGTEAIEVITRKAPSEVWVCLNNAGVPVCHGDIDKFSYSITPTGFILYADIKSNTVQVAWHAIFDLGR
jgi:hypothetical protein